MPPEPIYLDHAATTPVRAEVLEAIMPFFGSRFGNPSSVHRWGREARAALAEARQLAAAHEVAHEGGEERILALSAGGLVDDASFDSLVTHDVAVCSVMWVNNE